MVRNIHATVDDDVFRRLKDVKEDRSWEKAIIEEFGVEDDGS